MQVTDQKKRAASISLIIGTLMFAGKISAYLITNSSAILSDALESIVHIIATAFVFYSLYLSLRPPNKFYPFGYGKIEYFSAGFEGALIIVAAISIIYYAVHDIITGSPLKSLDIGALIIFLASVINLVLGFYLIRTGRKTNSLILVADGKHVLTDSYTSIGVMIGIIIVMMTGIKIIDPIVAILVAVNIIFTGKSLISKSYEGLMNRSEFEIIDKIAATLEEKKAFNKDWIDIHRFRYWKSGENYFIQFHLIVPYYLDIKHAHEYNEKIDNEINNAFEHEHVEVMLHFDYCNKSYCSRCRKDDCSVRGSKFTDDVKWDAMKIVSLSSFQT